jgi:hypothetical protein
MKLIFVSSADELVKAMLVIMVGVMVRIRV